MSKLKEWWSNVAILRKELTATVTIKERGDDTLDWEQTVQRWTMFGIPIYQTIYFKQVDFAEEESDYKRIGFKSN